MANILPIVVKNKPVNKTVFVLTRIVTKKKKTYQPSNRTSKSGEKVSEEK